MNLLRYLTDNQQRIPPWGHFSMVQTRYTVPNVVTYLRRFGEASALHLSDDEQEICMLAVRVGALEDLLQSSIFDTNTKDLAHRPMTILLFLCPVTIKRGSKVTTGDGISAGKHDQSSSTEENRVVLEIEEARQRLLQESREIMMLALRDTDHADNIWKMQYHDSILRLTDEYIIRHRAIVANSPSHVTSAVSDISRTLSEFRETVARGFSQEPSGRRWYDIWQPAGIRDLMASVSDYYATPNRDGDPRVQALEFLDRDIISLIEQQYTARDSRGANRAVELITSTTPGSLPPTNWPTRLLCTSMLAILPGVNCWYVSPWFIGISYTWDLQINQRRHDRPWFSDQTIPLLNPDGYGNLVTAIDNTIDRVNEFCWIDALCIQQDAPEATQAPDYVANTDIQRELPRSSEYYSAAGCILLFPSGLSQLLPLDALSQGPLPRYFSRVWAIPEILSGNNIRLVFDDGIRDSSDCAAIMSQNLDSAGTTIGSSSYELLTRAALSDLTPTKAMRLSLMRTSKMTEDAIFAMQRFLRLQLPIQYSSFQQVMLQAIRASPGHIGSAFLCLTEPRSEQPYWLPQIITDGGTIGRPLTSTPDSIVLDNDMLKLRGAVVLSLANYVTETWPSYFQTSDNHVTRNYVDTGMLTCRKLTKILADRFYAPNGRAHPDAIARHLARGDAPDDFAIKGLAVSRYLSSDVLCLLLEDDEKICFRLVIGSFVEATHIIYMGEEETDVRFYKEDFWLCVVEEHHTGKTLYRKTGVLATTSTDLAAQCRQSELHVRDVILS